MNMRKAVIGTLLVGALALSVGAVSAQGRGGNRPTGPGGRVGDVLALVVEQTGLDVREIMQRLRDGSTLAQLIEANGGDVDAVIAAAVEVATARINQAAEAGRITADTAEALLAQVEQQVTEAVNGSYGPLVERFWGQFQDRTGRGRSARGPWEREIHGWFPGIRVDIIALAAEQTGLNASDILSQLADGETLGDILRANDVDINAFVEVAVAQTEEQASARTQERLDALRERLLDLLGETQSL